MEALIERFCRYVRIDSRSDEESTNTPSTPGQLEMNRLLKAELDEMGLSDVVMDEHGIVTATLPATVADAPTIAWIAHVDTSPEFTATNVRPIVHREYDGKDIVLPGSPDRVIRADENPELATLQGKTIITTDGTTLLGADDKAGVAVIMEAAALLLAHPDIAHGPIRICFTCDEEIGRGVEHIDADRLGASVAYTLDGEGQGKIENETFSADAAVVTITGVNIHPGYAKGRMVNAIRAAGAFLDQLPAAGLSPETTDGRDGFIHPYQVEGGVAEVKIKVILRDFDTARLAEYKAMLESTAGQVTGDYPGVQVDIAVRKQYRNMAEGLAKVPRAVALAAEAMRAAGIEPTLHSIRGGTDGSGLTEKGVPTPNLSVGMHNFHSPLEWACAEEMQSAVDVLVALAQAWGRQG